MAALVLLPVAATGQERVPRFERFVGLTAQPGFLNDPYGVAVSPADDGRAFVVDRGNARIQVFSPTGQALGVWGSRGNGRHQFWLPSDVAVSPDGRYVYVLDQGQRQIKRFEPAPDCFPPGERECFTDSRTVVFGYFGQMMDPTGLAVDLQGRVLATDTVLHRVLVFDAAGGELPGFGVPGTGPGELLNPTDVAVHPDGTIWVADTGNNRISFFTPDGQYKGQWTGGGKNGELFHPTGIAIDRDGRFIVRDFERSYQLPQASLYESSKTNVWSVSLGDGETQGVYAFQGAAFLPDGTALLTDPAAEDAVLIQVLPNGRHSRWGATRGRYPLQFDHPRSVALDEQLLAVVDAGNRRAVIVQQLPEGERFLTILGPPLKPEFELVNPQGVAIHRSGPEMDEAVVYVTDAGSHSVWVSSPTGDRLARWGDGTPRSGPEGLKAPHGIAVAPDGDVYIADTGNNRIVRRAGYPRDEVLGIIGRTGDGPGELEFPRAVAYGPGEQVFVLETVKNRLQAFTPDGAFVAEWDSGQAKNVEPGELWMPQALASDGQYLYILECDAPYDHVRVQVVDPQPGVPLADSLVATFADRPGPGPGQVWDPHGLAAAGGVIAVADTGNNRLALFRWQDEREAPTATLTPTPEPPSATPTPTDEPATATLEPATATLEPATATPEPATATPELATATPELETATPTVTVAPATDTPEATQLTPTPTSSSLPSPTPSATSTAPATATGAVSPSATATDPPSANTQPTPIGGGRRLYMPLTVKSYFVGIRWR